MKEKNDVIEHILSKNKAVIGNHFDMYKNHVYRVFLLCRMMDNNKENIGKYAIAAACHDIGIWTHDTFDYLGPSIQYANDFLKKEGKSRWEEEIKLMINFHHKRSEYTGPYENTVEYFRRSDWVDVTKGRMSFGLNEGELKTIIKEYPLLGFHKFLLSKTLKNIFSNPLNPLPMFRK